MVCNQNHRNWIVKKKVPLFAGCNSWTFNLANGTLNGRKTKKYIVLCSGHLCWHHRYMGDKKRQTFLLLTRILAYISLLIVMIIFSNRLFFNISIKIPDKSKSHFTSFVTNLKSGCISVILWVSLGTVLDGCNFLPKYTQTYPNTP
jgi:hypothetical protein